MKRLPSYISILIVFIVFMFTIPLSALGMEPETPFFSSHRPLESSSLDYFSKNLSSSAWLITEGLDPRISDSKGNAMGNQFPPKDPKVRGISAQPAGAGQGPLVPYRSPSPKFSRNILVTRDFSRYPFQTEPSLAVNPKDPEQLILGVIDYAFPGITTYNTIDGGSTWHGPYQVKYPMNDLAGAGDPVITYDRNGTAYAASISTNVEEFTINSASGSAGVSSIPISKSDDGGVTWSEPIASAASHVDTKQSEPDAQGRIQYELILPFLDKPWVTVGPNKDDSSKDIIYVTYTKFVTRLPIVFLFDVQAFSLVPVTETTIEIVRSEDGGITWSEPIKVSETVSSTMGEDVPKRVVQGSQPAVAQDGTLYITWMDSTDDDSFEGMAEIYLATSTDNGRTFDVNKAADFNEIGYSPRNTSFRYWASSFPQIAAGPGTEVYIVYTGRSPSSKSDDGNIYFLSSKNGGSDWAKKTLNDDNTNRLQFFPSLTTSPDGTVHAMWGDMRDDPSESKYHVYYSSSSDGGNTWIENARVTDFPSNPNYAFPGGVFIGDYFTIKATNDEVYMAWPDARLGEFGTQNQKIGFARKGLMPLPSVFLSPPSGPGGKDVTIQGDNFQPDQDVYLEISGAVVSTVRSDDDGRFTARLFIPISGEGAHDFRAIDASGNIATSSFYMDFGFDNIQGSINQITEDVSSLRESVATGETSPSLESDLLSIQESLESINRLDKNNTSTELLLLITILALIIFIIIAILVLFRTIKTQPQ